MAQNCKSSQHSALAKAASNANNSKSISSSTKQLNIGKKKFNQSLLLFGNTNKDRNSTANMESMVRTEEDFDDESLRASIDPILIDSIAFADQTIRVPKKSQ
jgi:hypothetical protein